MWKWWVKDLALSPRWSICVLMSLYLFVQACSGGCSSESEFLIQFIQAIDPKNVLDISLDGQVPDCCSVMQSGIKCDMLSLNITEIRLDNMNLSGKIDADSLCKIPSLRVVNLANNFVHGVIPESISNCVSLTYLNLSNNMLQGMVPTTLSRLKNLRSLDTSSNNLTELIPQHVNITKLSPPNMNSSAYYHTEFDDRHPPNRCMRPSTFVPLLLFLMFFSLFAFFTYKRIPKLTDEKANKKHILESPMQEIIVSTEEEDNEKGGEEVDLILFSKKYKRFCITELLKSPAEPQGQNFYSTLYKVRLTDSAAMFAVKRLKNSQISQDDFRREFTQIGNLKHPNILPLVAVNSSENEKLLIYEYQETGSLSSLLSSYAKKEREFPWRHRLSIMSGIARGLDHIARESRESNVPAHGNLKPSNVILSVNEDALISEFGIWGFLDPTQAFLYSSSRYRAPEKRFTSEGDIFSFGVILLEMLTGKVIEAGSSLNLPKWVKSMVREEWTGEVLDKEVSKAGKQWAFILLNVALKCVADLPERRPNISEVLEKIEYVLSSQESTALSPTSSHDESI